MKKLLSLAVLLCASVAMMAQNYEMNVYSNGARVFNHAASTTDSIKFADGNATIGYDNLFWTRKVNQIDSIVFGIASTDTTSADTNVVDLTDAIYITWGTSGVDVTNSHSDVTVSVDGQDVTVTSSAAADLVYCLSGSSTDGSLTITTDNKFILYLNGLNLTNSDGAAINCLSSKRMCIHTAAGTTNSLSDGASSADKGALQGKGKIDLQGSGTLNISGLAKHGIQSSGKTDMLSGTVNILAAVKDGLNVDDFVMDGGVLTVTCSGDGIDGDEGYIEINGGTINVTLSSDDVKGIACDSTLTINGGTTTVTVSGDQSKCVKSGSDIYIYGGTNTLNANGTVVMEASGSGYDPSFCTALKSSAAIYIEGGSNIFSCASTNAGGKGIDADGDIYLDNGTTSITALGGSSSYTDAEGSTDSYASAGIKSDGSITVNGGTYTVNAGGKAITCDDTYTQNGGQLTLTTNGTGAVTVGSGTSATDGYASAAVKADDRMILLAGRLTGTSTGKGGRGLVSDYLQVGATGASNDLLDINIYTSGAPVNASSSGGMGHGGSTSDYWKGLPKGVKIEDTILINSGTLSVYCSQTSGDPTAEAIESKGVIIINGGEVEANSYDDAINAATYLAINGGKVWAYSRGNDGIDCNGTYTYITGGTIYAQGSETGIDAGTDAGGHFYLTGGNIVALGSQMGAWDTPTLTGTQRYITASISTTNGFCLKNSSGTEMMVFKQNTVSGSGFVDTTNGTGTKPPGGGGGGNPGGGGSGSSSGSAGITCEGMTYGTYTVFSSPTISGGSSWHGFYTGATCTTSGSGTSATTR